MALKNPAAEECKPGFWSLGAVDDLVSQSQTSVGWLRGLIEGSNHAFWFQRPERNIWDFLIPDQGSRWGNAN